MSDKQIQIFTGPGGMNLLDDKRSVSLPVETLRANLASFLASLQQALPPADQKAAGLGLKSIEVALGIDGKGTVGFLGTGAEVGANATLTLTFERP